MGLASDVSEAISEGVNGLCALLAWIDAGASEAPPVDQETLGRTMAALEGAVREVLHGGRVEGADPPYTGDDLARLIRLEGLLAEWASTGVLSAEVATLADACVRGLCGGASWRVLVAAASAARAGQATPGPEAFGRVPSSKDEN